MLSPSQNCALSSALRTNCHWSHPPHSFANGQLVLWPLGTGIAPPTSQSWLCQTSNDCPKAMPTWVTADGKHQTAFIFLNQPDYTTAGWRTYCSKLISYPILEFCPQTLHGPCSSLQSLAEKTFLYLSPSFSSWNSDNPISLSLPSDWLLPSLLA